MTNVALLHLRGVNMSVMSSTEDWGHAGHELTTWIGLVREDIVANWGKGMSGFA